MTRCPRCLKASYAVFDVSNIDLSRYSTHSSGDIGTLTASVGGYLPPDLLAEIPGQSREHLRWEEGKRGIPDDRTKNEWEAFVDDIGRRGVLSDVLIDVYPEGPFDPVSVYEGNHRIRAALQAGLADVPVEVRFFGHAECDTQRIPWTWPTGVYETLESRCEKVT